MNDKLKQIVNETLDYLTREKGLFDSRPEGHADKNIERKAKLLCYLELSNRYC